MDQRFEDADGGPGGAATPAGLQIAGTAPAGDAESVAIVSALVAGTR